MESDISNLFWVATPIRRGISGSWTPWCIEEVLATLQITTCKINPTRMTTERNKEISNLSKVPEGFLHHCNAMASISGFRYIHLIRRMIVENIKSRSSFIGKAWGRWNLWRNCNSETTGGLLLRVTVLRTGLTIMASNHSAWTTSLQRVKAYSSRYHRDLTI